MNNRIYLSDKGNLEFLRSAYETILGRAPDEVGLESYTNRLNLGVPRFRIILDLITSPEAKFRGFDAREIEDVIAFYLKAKNNLMRPIVDGLIARRYSDRIFNFFHRIRFAHQSNRQQPDSATDGTTAAPVAAPCPDDQKSYTATREQAEALLERLYTNRRMNPRDPLVDDAIGIHVPRWVGVTNSTKSFFAHTFPIPLSREEAPEHLSEDQIKALSDVLVDAAFSQLVFSGGDYFQYRIAKSIKERAPRKRIKVIWHGSPRQLGPHYELDPFLAWVSAAREGICEAIGTVKPGMKRLFDGLGVRAHFLQNSVTVEPDLAEAHSRPDTVGMWLSHIGNYNKPVAPTLFALARSRNLALQGAGFGEDGIQLIQHLGIPHKSISPSTVPHARVTAGMRTSKLTIYITLSECMPMVPFESIGEGAPCLVGPSTRLYDDPFLEDHLIVRNPFDPVEISTKIEQAVARHDELLRASTDFLLRSKARSTRDLAEFLA